MNSQKVLLSMLLLAALTSAALVAQESSREAFAKLEGLWVAEKVLVAGEQVPQEKFPFELLFADGKLTYKFVGNSKGQDRVHELIVNTSNDPWSMDITRMVGEKKATVRAIYKLEGEKLLICFLRGPDRQPSKDRPSSFESNATVKSDLLILKRKPPVDK
jgi:uncharacterized protein (TIGR03067 family)